MTVEARVPSGWSFKASKNLKSLAWKGTPERKTGWVSWEATQYKNEVGKGRGSSCRLERENRYQFLRETNDLIKGLSGDLMIKKLNQKKTIKT